MARSKTPTFVWQMSLEYSKCNEYKLDDVFRWAEEIYKNLTRDRIRAKVELEKNHEYKDIMTELDNIWKRKQELSDLRKKNDELPAAKKKVANKPYDDEEKELRQRQTELYEKRNKLIQSYGFSEFEFKKRVAKYRKQHKKAIASHVAQSIAGIVWTKFNKYFFGAKKGNVAKKVSLSGKKEYLNIIPSRTYNSGIVFKRYTDKTPKKLRDKYIGEIRIGKYVDKLYVVRPKTMRDEEAFLERIKYIDIKRTMMKSGYRYTACFSMEGTPPQKYDENGRLSYPLGKGKVGIDIGLKLVAVSTADKVFLYELAPGSDNPYEEIGELNQKLDNLKRSANPEYFDEEGRYIKWEELPKELLDENGRRKWKYSNHSQLLNNRRKWLYGKTARIRKQEQNILANEILTLGDEFIIENNDFARFAKRKPPQRKEDMKPGEKFKSRKAGGKSISNRAPAQFVSILEAKVKAKGGTVVKINPAKAKITQFNHMTGEYKPQKISERWDVMPDGEKIQRNMYNAFLLQHIADDHEHVDVEACNRDYAAFLEMEKETIEYYKTNGYKLPFSSGIDTNKPKEEASEND